MLTCINSFKWGRLLKSKDDKIKISRKQNRQIKYEYNIIYKILYRYSVIKLNSEHNISVMKLQKSFSRREMRRK